MSEQLTITGGGARIEALCHLKIDHERGIHVSPELLNEILQGQDNREVDWSHARIVLTNEDA